MNLKVGNQASRSKLITDEAVSDFVRAIGDTNPIHLDEADAATSCFVRRLTYGILTGSLISPLQVMTYLTPVGFTQDRISSLKRQFLLAIP